MASMFKPKLYESINLILSQILQVLWAISYRVCWLILDYQPYIKFFPIQGHPSIKVIHRN